MNIEQQRKKIFSLLKEFKTKTGKIIHIQTYDYNQKESLYHELGHLQDFAKNLKELDIKKWKLPNFKEIYNDVKNNKKHINDSDIEHVDNRWSGTTYDGFEELLKNNPQKFKKKYPDLYEFLTNKDYQASAGKVSWYAQTSIGEFIAEVYKDMMAGKTLPEDVMKLYRKYNGPEIP